MDLKHKRGTKGTLQIPLKGNHTNRELSFVVKRGLKDSDDRIIVKLKSLNQISVQYDSGKDITNCSIPLKPSETDGIKINSYPWDIDSISLTDPEDITTPEGGLFVLMQKVQGPGDGVDLPQNAERYIAILSSAVPVGTFFRRADNANHVEGVDLSSTISNAAAAATHIASQSNPHQTTASQVGAYTSGAVDTLLLMKVDKVTGKGLSSEDYSTAEKNKLGTVQENANYYLHPESHPATMITVDATHRFVTDTLINTWNSKQDALGFTAENAENKNIPGGYAGLDLSTGKIPISLLPTNLLDDYTEYANYAALPAVGETDLLYITIDDNKLFRWTGSTYVEVSTTHNHANFSLLETYNQSNTDLSSAVSLKHSHTNKATLDLIDVAFTTALKTNYDAAYTALHSHSNKANLDTINQALATTSDVAHASLALGGATIGTNKLAVNGDTYFNGISVHKSYIQIAATTGTGAIYIQGAAGSNNSVVNFRSGSSTAWTVGRNGTTTAFNINFNDESLASGNLLSISTTGATSIATSLSIGGATIGTNALAVTGTSLFNSAMDINIGNVLGGLSISSANFQLKIVDLGGGQPWYLSTISNADFGIVENATTHLTIAHTTGNATFAGSASFGGITNNDSYTLAVKTSSGNGIVVGTGADLSIATNRRAFIGSASGDGGGRILLWDNAGNSMIDINGATPYISFRGDVVLARDAANTLALRNGANGQTFNIYNAYTDASNYEKTLIGWAGNIYYIAVTKAGTGVARDIWVGNATAASIVLFSNNTGRWQIPSTGHLVPYASNSYDLGTSSTTVRTGYFGTSIINAGYMELGSYLKQTAIANTSAPNNSIFIDSADNLLKFKNNAGTLITLS